MVCSCARLGALRMLSSPPPTRGIPQAEAREGILENLMLRRAPEPDEIADAVLFFASRMSRSVTAQCLDVTSGEFAH